MEFRILMFVLLSYHSTTIYAGGADVFAYQEGKIITLFPDTRHQDKKTKNSNKKMIVNKTLTTMRTAKGNSKSTTTEVISD